jgi:hypothetical protein
MSGERAFDDDRWPDEETKACCFLCGRIVDPRDPKRGTYTPNVSACEPLPIHIPCLDNVPITEVHRIAVRALMTMSAANAKKMREAAKCAVVSPLGT